MHLNINHMGEDQEHTSVFSRLTTCSTKQFPTASFLQVYCNAPVGWLR